MKLLLDTHTFIWWSSEPAQLSQHAIQLLEDNKNQPIISAANVWEIVIKQATGKIKLTKPLEEVLQSYIDNNIEVLHITARHVLMLKALSDIHRDPFDRILIAQALVEEAHLVTKDPVITRYPVKTLW